MVNIESGLKLLRINRIWRALVDRSFEEDLTVEEKGLCEGAIGWASPGGNIEAFIRYITFGLSNEEIEEAVQDCVIHLYQAFEAYDFARKLKPFVVCVVKNRVLNWIRTRGKEDHLSIFREGAGGEEHDITDGIVNDTTRSVEDVVESDETVASFLRLLPEYERRVCELFLEFGGGPEARVQVANAIRDEAHGRKFDWDENGGKIAGAMRRLRKIAKASGLGE